MSKCLLAATARPPASLQAICQRGFHAAEPEPIFIALNTQEISSEHADMPVNLQPEVRMDGGYEKTC